jgi:hypothetical protein
VCDVSESVNADDPKFDEAGYCGFFQINYFPNLTGVRHHPSRRTDKNLCRCFGAPACRVFLITFANITSPRGRRRRRTLGAASGAVWPA